jgi:6-phosphogluconolactonase (cycloisomerase 2 family)
LSYAVGAKGKLSLKSNATLAPAMNPVFINQLGDYIIVANYHGPDDGTTDDGTAGISSLKVSEDCSLTMAQFLPEKGRSVDPGRQGMSHVHSVNALPKSKTQFVVCDLGADALISMKMDPSTGMMSETSRLHTTVGSGPRHMAFHPTLPIAYTLFEMGSFVGAYNIAAGGGLKEAQVRSDSCVMRLDFHRSDNFVCLFVAIHSSPSASPPCLAARSILATPRPPRLS